MSLIIAAFMIQLFIGPLLAGIKPHLVTMPPEKNYFTAAVLEHARLGNWTTEEPADIIAKNLDYYRRAASIAKSKGADIIVFPEYGFLPLKKRKDMKEYLEIVPDPKQGKYNPCRQVEEFSQSPTLRELSCIARDHQIVVVANMITKRPCTIQQNSKCPKDVDAWFLNTNFAFDKDGTLIGVYNKEHLYFELFADLPPEPQDPIFKTDFGTFAMFICFESIFKKMALAFRNESIDAVILSAYWIDGLPLLSSIQHWSSLAIGNKANHIVSDVQMPGSGTTGSGIFLGKMGTSKHTHALDNKSKLIVSKVPKRSYRGSHFDSEASITVITANGSEPYNTSLDEEGEKFPEICFYKYVGESKDILKDYRCNQEPTVNYTFRRLTEPEGTVEACNNGQCCSVTYSAQSMNDTFYLGVYNGTHNSYDRYYWCEEICSVVRCDDYNGSDCNTFPSKSNTVFNRLELKSNFTTKFIYPSVMKRNVRLSPKDEWTFVVEEQDTNFSGRLVYESLSDKPMLSAVLNGRCYDRDPPYKR